MEEKLSKQKAKQLLESGDIDQAEVGAFASMVKDLEIKHLLKGALTDQIHDRALYMKSIDVSYYYEGYSEYKVEDF